MMTRIAPMWRTEGMMETCIDYHEEVDEFISEWGPMAIGHWVIGWTLWYRHAARVLHMGASCED